MPWEFAPEMRTSRRPKIATTDGPRPRGDVSYPAADAGSDRCGSEPSGAADLRAGGAMTGSSVGLTTCAAGPFAPGRAPQHGTATLAPLLTLAALPPGVAFRGQRAPSPSADRPVGVGTESFDGADLEAAIAVVAEQWIDHVRDREAGGLGDGAGGAGRLTGATPDALFYVYGNSHRRYGPVLTVAGEPAASKIACKVPM